MADVINTLSQLATAFEKVTASHVEELTNVKAAALRHKAECDQFVADMARKYDKLADTAQTALNTLSGLLAEFRPLLGGVQQLAKKPTTKKHTGKKATA